MDLSICWEVLGLCW